MGATSDAVRYTSLLQAGKELYLKTYYNPSTHCFADCMYVSQIFGLSLGLLPEGSADEAAVWANAMSWFTVNGTNAKYGERFGGGIIALKLAYPLLHRFNLDGLGLRWQLASGNPSFGQWIDYEATTLWEAYPLTPTSGGASYNHIMFGGSGVWYYQALAGLARQDGSRSWSKLDISPPSSVSNWGDPVTSMLSFASASLDTPMGLASSSWSVSGAAPGYTECASVAENSDAVLTCDGGVFTDVAFASYGTPSGSCAKGFTEDPTCNAATSVSVVKAACVGKSSCTITASNDKFGGDPCVNVPKQLSVALTGSCTNKPPRYNLQTTIPANAVASVTVPLQGLTPATAVITESKTTVWQNGKFVPGVAGVTSASATNTSVTFQVGSGSYDFTLA